MDPILAIVYKLFDIGLIMVGFGFVVFLHELGHFVAAKWASVRVQAFAIGFGNALFSYRKGMGIQRGSSEQAYKEWLVRKNDGATAPEEEISPTEYRFNSLPLGGYVKMLGQDDAHPTYRSEEPDSYTSIPNWKRMVIISAGVTMNIITAAILYVVVFMAGLQTEPPMVGAVALGSPAESAKLVNAVEVGFNEPGLKPGDLITAINGEKLASFNDVILATAMAKGKTSMDVRVRREGSDKDLLFEMTPVQTDIGLQQIGVEPAFTSTLRSPQNEAETAGLKAAFEQIGIGSVPFGSELVSIDDQPVSYVAEIDTLVSEAEGEPVTLTFEHEGQRFDATIQPSPVMDVSATFIAGQERGWQHISGLTPVMVVGPESPISSSDGYQQGLREGDLFVRLGAASYPSAAQGVSEVSSRAGSEIDATVLRQTDEGEKLIDLSLKVKRNGTVGFTISGKHDHTYLAAPPVLETPLPTDMASLRPGSRIISIAGEPVSSFAEIQRTLQRVTTPGEATTIPIAVELPFKDEAGQPIRREIDLAFTPEQATHLAEMSWHIQLSRLFFEPEVTTLKASGPIGAIGMGLHETKRVMTNTYLTFLRLFQGSVSPTNLNGPVGIVHIGTVVVSKGFIWLLFFFALVNVNLAVINFLPIPITDGGHMLFLLWEQFTGKPVSIAVQNAATLAGLVLIVAVFLFVTYNDISRLLGS